LAAIAAEAICVPWLKLFVDSMLIGRIDAPAPSIKDFLFGQEGQSRIQTSATTLEEIDGIDVSSAVSRIANVGTDVFGFRFACAGIAVIAIVVAISAIVVISFFIKLILLNSIVFVNRL
jgi:hypothetical protein